MIKRDVIEQKDGFEQNYLEKDILQQPQRHELLPQWQIMRLEDIATLQRGNDLPVNHREQGIYPVVGSNGIVGYHSEFIVKGPGVLVGRSGSVGKVTWIENNFWPLNTTLWVKDLHGNDPHFIYYLLCYLDLGRFTGGVSVPTLNRNVVHPLKVAIPPFSQQQAIARVLRVVEEAIQARRDELTLELERKAALMEYLFTHGAREETTKQTEIGEIPQSWQVVWLGELSKVVSGGTPDRSKAEYWDGDVPWVKTGEINYKIINKTEERITKKGLENSSAKIIPSGTLLMAMYGQGITRGRVAILGIDAAINQACAAIFVSADILTDFLFHFCTYNYEKIRSLGHGANQKNLNSVLIKSIMLPIMPLDEQTEIVSALNASDAKLTTLAQEITLLEELFRALLEELMTGQLSTSPLIEEGENHE